MKEKLSIGAALVLIGISAAIISTGDPVQMAEASERIPMAYTPINLGAITVGQWKLNDNAASPAIADAMGVNNGTLRSQTTNQNTNQAGLPHHIAGKIDGAIQFDGSNDNIIFAEFATPFGTSNFSISFWFKTSMTAISFMFQDYGSDTDNTVQCRTNADGTVQFYIRDAEEDDITINSVTAYNDGAWHYFYGARDGSTTARMIIDSNETLTGSNANLGTINTSAGTQPDAGTYPNYTGFAFAGSLDDMRVFNRALTTPEIKWLYNRGAGREDNRGAW